MVKWHCETTWNKLHRHGRAQHLYSEHKYQERGIALRVTILMMMMMIMIIIIMIIIIIIIIIIRLVWRDSIPSQRQCNV